MLKFRRPFIALIILLSIAAGSCRSRGDKHRGKLPDESLYGAFNHQKDLPFDSNLLVTFYKSFPLLQKYREEVTEVYRLHNYTHIWFDAQGVVEFGNTLYNKAREMNAEGVSSVFPYQEKIDGVFNAGRQKTMTATETELMLTNLYLFYTEKVYRGLGDSTTTAIGWLLPRQQLSYARLIDSVMSDPGILNNNDSVLFSQYYKLREALKRYRGIEKKGGWGAIEMDPKVKSYKPGDTAKAIRQIRDRLVVTGELKQNSHSSRYDPELAEALKTFQLHTGFNPTEKILPEHIRELNIPVGERIKTIIVNMERCRWISPGFSNAREYIVVNIPSFKLTMVHDGKIELESPVIVGDSMTKTVIFSGMMSHIVFSPYWNLPPSIINKEVKPGMAKNINYLEKHNMEWNNGQVRQKPGKNNSLGLIKFIFPNADDIYIHDTPAKSLFAREKRAFSHGCIRVGKPRELAIALLADDPAWTPAKIDAAMHKGEETSCRLKNKIPVYIGYLTAWVDRQGGINFYKDVYRRDARLAALLAADK